MIKTFKGPHSFNDYTIRNWDSSEIGVYYCGVKTTDGKLTIYYIGRSIGDDGMRGRLLQHLGENKWQDVTHFGYEGCSTEQEVIQHESSEIATYKPKYNTQGK